jgi:protein-disulfide isomerase
MSSYENWLRGARLLPLPLAALLACTSSERDPGARAVDSTVVAAQPGSLRDSAPTASTDTPSADTGKASPASTNPSASAATESRPARRVDSVASRAKPSDATERSPRRVVVAGVDLTGVGYDKGSADAPVVMVNFSDFGCPYCASFAREGQPVIEREYVRTGKVFLKYVPFVAGMFPNGQQAARTAECSAEQGTFWPMHDRLYAEQKQWKNTIYALPIFQKDAAALGLDTARFTRCYETNHLHPRSKVATDAADRLRIRVTPSFVVNGTLIEGALPLPQFRELLDAALKEKP